MTFLKSFLILVILGMTSAYNPYQYSCPNVLKISKGITNNFVSKDPTIVAGLLRMIFHDCIVRGCDASVLLDPTPSNNATEKTAKFNLSLRGYEVIDAIKAELEKRCPGVVSCADILALASRDAVAAINGPLWHVPLGRKDGKISLATEVLQFMPSPFSNVSTLKNNFADVGLSSKDLVVLSGAHTIGDGHCSLIQKRLYNFTGNGDTDPEIDPAYAEDLKSKCPPNKEDLTTVVPMTQRQELFNGKYYTMVSQRKGMFESDAALLDDNYTRSYIEYQVSSNGATFNKDFSASMTKLISVGVLNSSQGEVRKTCGAVN